MKKDLSFLVEAEQFVQSHFSFGLKNTSLKILSETDWSTFCTNNNFDHRADGLFLPPSLTAYVRQESPTFISDTFHELFGHGLFCEQSSLSPLRQSSDLQGLFVEPLLNYEGFAVWIEKYLCKETDNQSIWLKKEKSLPKWYLQALDACEEFIQQYSEFEFTAQMGFPKMYSVETLQTVLKNIYGPRLQGVDFAIHYGSANPESDINLFVVSSNPSQNYFNGWLDIYEVNRYDFITWANNLDLSVTDPLFSGSMIYGDVRYVQKLKDELTRKPIDSEVLSFYETEIQKLHSSIPKDARTQKYKESYLKSYTAQLEQLIQGNKYFTFKDLQTVGS